MSPPSQPVRPGPSALTEKITQSNAKTESQALPLEIIQNLRHQHKWRDLHLHTISLSVPTSNSTSSSTNKFQSSGHINSNPFSSVSPTPVANSSTNTNMIKIISGLPPIHAYLHPDFQNHLVRHSIPESSIAVQREWVLPLSLGEKWTLRRFAGVFDALPLRDVMEKVEGDGDEEESGGEQVRLAEMGRGRRRSNENGNGTVRDRDLGIEWKDSKRVLLGMLGNNGMGGDGTVVYYVMQEGEVKPRQNG